MQPQNLHIRRQDSVFGEQSFPKSRGTLSMSHREPNHGLAARLRYVGIGTCQVQTPLDQLWVDQMSQCHWYHQMELPNPRACKTRLQNKTLESGRREQVLLPAPRDEMFSHTPPAIERDVEARPCPANVCVPLKSPGGNRLTCGSRPCWNSSPGWVAVVGGSTRRPHCKWSFLSILAFR